MRRFAIVVLAGFALCSISCARRPAAPAAASANPRIEGDRPVIVRLAGRNQTLTVTKGDHGPLYSVTDANGAIVCAPSTLDEIAAKDPELHRYINAALASNAADVAGESRRR